MQVGESPPESTVYYSDMISLSNELEMLQELIFCHSANCTGRWGEELPVVERERPTLLEGIHSVAHVHTLKVTEIVV